MRLVARVSEVYQVSWWCAVRRLSASKACGVSEALGRSYLLLLVGRSGQTGRGRGQVALRVLDCWWPSEVDGLRVKAGYPGLRVAHLGREFEEVVCNMAGTRRGELVCQIRLLSKEGEEVKMALRGFLQQWGSGVDGRIVVYGSVSSGPVAGGRAKSCRGTGRAGNGDSARDRMADPEGA